MRVWFVTLLIASGCAHHTPQPIDPFWAEVERSRPLMSVRGEYEAQVRCLSARTVVVWQCDGDRCRSTYECPNMQRNAP